MSTTPVEWIEPEDLQHEAEVTLQDIAYLTRRYRALYQRVFPHAAPESALLVIQGTIARAYATTGSDANE